MRYSLKTGGRKSNSSSVFTFFYLRLQNLKNRTIIATEVIINMYMNKYYVRISNATVQFSHAFAISEIDITTPTLTVQFHNTVFYKV